MNSCILMVEISTPPQLRHTPENVEMAEMMVIFPGLRPDDPPSTLRVIGWGKTASDIHVNYHPGDRVVIEGRLGMRTFDRPEGFKEKRAELTIQKIYRLGAEFNLGSSIPAGIPMNTAPSSPSIPNYEPSMGASTQTYQPPVTNPAPNYQQPVATPAPTYQPPAAPNYTEDYDADDIPF